MMIALADGRRFIVPSAAATTATSDGGDMVKVDYEWPVGNKKLCKHIQDMLSHHRIPHRLDVPSRGLFVDHPNPLDIAHFCRFHERTHNHSYTHFVSLPLFHDDGLVAEVTRLHGDAGELAGLPKRCHQGPITHAFTSPSRLHLTVCMLTLMSGEDVAVARNIIDNYCATLKPFKVALKGLDVLKGTPEACRVLVANAANQHNLHSFDTLTRLLLHQKLSDTLPPTRWHCTLINGKYYDRHYKVTNCTFDVRKLLRKSTAFGKPVEVDVNQVHLSCLNSTGHPQQPYYQSAHTQSLL